MFNGFSQKSNIGSFSKDLANPGISNSKPIKLESEGTQKWFNNDSRYTSLTVAKAPPTQICANRDSVFFVINSNSLPSIRSLSQKDGSQVWELSKSCYYGGIAVDDTGIYVIQDVYSGAKIYKYDLIGNPASLWTNSDKAYAKGITTEKGKIYVSYYGAGGTNSGANCYDKDGNLVWDSNGYDTFAICLDINNAYVSTQYSGIIKKLDKATGATISGQSSTNMGSNPFKRLITDGINVYGLGVGADGTTTYLEAYSCSSLALQWSISLGTATQTTILVDNKNLYLFKHYNYGSGVLAFDKLKGTYKKKLRTTYNTAISAFTDGIFLYLLEDYYSYIEKVVGKDYILRR